MNNEGSLDNNYYTIQFIALRINSFNNTTTTISFILFLLLLSLASTGKAQLKWHYQKSETNNNLIDIHFINKQIGWVSGADGIILHTNDRGLTWSVQNSTSSSSLISIQFIDEYTGWIAGTEGTIIHTKDGGKSWKEQESGSISNLLSIHFIDEQTGWATGSRGAILHTHDGGQTWRKQDNAFMYSLNDIHFTDDQVGWVAGEHGLILHTSDGGQTWRMQDSGTLSYLRNIHFIDDRTGMVVGSRGTILRTSDGGQTWSEQSNEFKSDLKSIQFINEKIGWAAGEDGKIIFTTDGGQKWTKQNSGTSRQLNSIHFINEHFGWAVGSQGTILSNSIKFDNIADDYPQVYNEVSNNYPELFEERGQFESTEDFTSRKDEAKEVLLEALIPHMEKQQSQRLQTIAESRTRISPEAELGTYDPDDHIYPITIEGITDELKIPPDEARMLYEHIDDAEVVAIRQKTEDLKDTEIVNHRLVHPITGEEFPVGEQIELEEPEPVEEEISRPPRLAVDDPQFTDTDGSNRLAARERATIDIAITNEGEGDARGVTVSGRTEADISGLSATLGTIPAGETRTVSLTASGGEELEDGEAELTLEFEEDGGFDPAPIRMTVPTAAYRPPELAIADVGVEDDRGRGLIEPGSVVDVTMRVVNRGGGTAERVEAEVQAGPNVFVNGREQGSYTETIGRLQPGEWADVSFEAFANTRAETFALSATLSEAEGTYGIDEEELNLEMEREQLTIRELQVEGAEPQMAEQGEVPSLAVSIEQDLPQAGEVNEDAVAVVIGNQAYRGDAPDVTYALRDAALMRRYLTESFGFRPGNILYLENATFSEMRTVFGTESGPGRIGDLVREGRSDVFVFYSGHGAPDPDDDAGYLVPVDGDANNLDATGYKLELLYENLARVEARSTTVVVDACFSGAAGSGDMLIAEASPIGLEVENPAAILGEDAVVVSAAGGSEIASWHSDKRYGLLTYYFLQGIRGEADLTGDGRITAGELEMYLTDTSDGLPYTARALHGRTQTPQVWGDEDEVVLQLD